VKPPGVKRVGLGLESIKAIASGRLGKRKRVVMLMGNKNEYGELAKAALKGKIISSLITDVDFAKYCLLGESQLS